MPRSPYARREAAARSRLYAIAAIALTVLSLLVFIKFANELEKKELDAFDETVGGWILPLVHPALTLIMKALTFWGSSLGLSLVTAVAGLLLLFRRHRWEALFFVLSAGGAGLFNLLLKNIFKRERPTLHRLIEQAGYSFPSGHSMGSMATYGMLAVILCLFFPNKLARVLLLTAAALVIVLIGVSRIYLGVHYPSDVAAGFAAGAAWLLICLLALQAVRQARRSRRSRR
ncbi:phosphatase PAP2 family protein [Paenibacillus sp. J31TS4]|uniref:phosphatase PAP2 family protein n=1 Tax=Paenibacillus sp. J31TS4 TaxID=2807195 RepID=UPI001B05A193|nr:phosphatase PAP2 family protein [Paenibacillus sp. J31TS4]GIP37649.1 phosphatase PAP2 family protein [Paenibacillus sp. J31TS4]